MSDSQDCWAKLRELAAAGSDDPRYAAANIIRTFAGKATQDDVSLMRARLEDTLLAGKYTEVPSAYLRSARSMACCLGGRLRRGKTGTAGLAKALPA